MEGRGSERDGKVVCLYCLCFQGSWEKKLIDRVHNMRSSLKRSVGEDAAASPCKRGRPKGTLLLNRYPPVRVEGDYVDSVTNERNMKALVKELERDHPRKDHILPLLKHTYTSRREDILAESVDVTVTLLITKYPALCFPYAVSK